MVPPVLTRLTWGLIALVGGAWSVLVLLFSPALAEPWRVPAAVAAAGVFIFSLMRNRQPVVVRLAAVAVFGIVFGLWASLTPLAERDWVADVARSPWAEIDGDTVTVHNVRNFHYRTETDFDQVYEDRTVKLSELSEVDMIVSYWSGKAIAHIMVSFGFADKDFLTFSIETRKEKGESYSAVKGFFRNYELAYVVADERDVIGVRTTYREPNEEVYVLRTRIALENGRKLFLTYLKNINRLQAHPRFYNTLTTNCTTQVLHHVQAFGSTARYTWKILLSGYIPEYLFENDVLMPNMSLEEIMNASLVNERARAAGDAADFSVKIRQGVPKPEARRLSGAQSQDSRRATTPFQ